MLRSIRYSLLLSVAAILGACDKAPPEQPRVATKLVVTPGIVSLSETGSQQFTAKVLDQDNNPLSGAVVVWQSDHPELVSVDSTGIATAIGDFMGIATPFPVVKVTATAGTLAGTANVGLTFTGTFNAWPDTNVLYTGMTRTLRARTVLAFHTYHQPLEDSVPSASVLWSSTDPSIATVSGTGLITAIAPGHARIVAKFGTRQSNVEVYINAPPVAPFRFTSITSAAILVGRVFGADAVFGIRGCGLTNDGAAYCWGAAPEAGQISDRCEIAAHAGAAGDALIRYRCSEIPLRVQTDVAFIGLMTGAPMTTGGGFASGSFSCGLATSRQVYCWGTNANGELGIGTTDAVTHGVAPIAGTDQFTEIRGSSSACGIRSDGILRCWGGSFGSSPTAVSNGKAWLTIADAGGCGLAADSTAYCYSSGTAQSVGGATRWKSIAATASSRCAIALDDSTYCGSDLQTKQTLPQPVGRIGSYSTSALMDYGFRTDACGLTAGGDLRCAASGWGLVNLAVKLKSFYGFCGVGVDDKVYCRFSESGTLMAVVPGQ